MQPNNKWSKNFDERLHDGGFLLEKFNVALNCFCGLSTGLLVNSMRGNPDVRATGIGTERHAGKIPTSSPQKCPFP